MRASLTAWRFLWCFHIDRYGDSGSGLTNRQPLVKCSVTAREEFGDIEDLVAERP